MNENDNTRPMTDEELEERAANEHAGFGLEPWQPGPRLFGLLNEIGEGEEIPAWHGVWRYDHARQAASTAVLGLNLILALAFRLLCWAKHGGLRVSADPRQAFVDGLNAGHEAAVRELPEEVRNMRDIALAQGEAADRALRQYGPMLRLRGDFANFTDNLLKMKRPDSEVGGALVDHLQNVANVLKRRMDEAYAQQGYPATGDAQATDPAA